jgi:hypothetical protein
MIIEILLIWIIVFFILLAVNLAEKSHWFGVFAGIWLLILGLAIILTGVQMQSGMNIQTVGTWQNITYQYQNLTSPVYPYGGTQSSYSAIWGVIFILISIYITYSNAEDAM